MSLQPSSYRNVPCSSFLTDCCNLIHLCCVLSFYHPFYYQSSSWRFYIMVQQGFNSFSKCSSRFLLEEFKYSSSWIRSANLLPFLLRWCYIILENFHSCFAIHMLSRMMYFKSINLFVGVILCHISPKAFPKECCYFGAY